MASHPGLKNLFSYSLMSALAERRTRRIARGVSLDAAGVSHTSTNTPKPLSPLEEAVLIVSTGATLPVMHDGPLMRSDGQPELGSPFMNVMGRTASSPDNSRATKFFLINDDGIWLLKTLSDAEAVTLRQSLPTSWEDWSEADWLRAADAVKVKIADSRLEFPRRFPYYLGWNKQTSNVPGTTILYPVVDCTRQYINALFTVLAEPEGERPVLVDDWRQFHPADVAEAALWLGAQFGIPKKIPYHPIGGTKWVLNGFSNRDISAPLGMQRALRTDYESFFLLQNLMLVGQAMGLGGWVHSAVFAPWIFNRDPSKGELGLGFRMEEPQKEWQHWPPLPASQPNPVGIDGVLEGLCPPYVKSMDEAVDKFLDEKYGPKSMYGDVSRFAAPYKNPDDAREYLAHQVPFTKQSVEYVKEICNYLWETYGRFPAHVDAFYTPGIWVQFSHLEIEYYDKYYKPELFHRQKAHDATWQE